MEEKVLQDAVENISLIKEMINKTSKSFTAFSRIFIWWGMLFIFNSVIMQIMISNKEKMMEISMKYPLMNYFVPVGVIALIAFIIYRCITKKIPLIGLEKHLMVLWILTLIMNTIPSKIMIHSTDLSANMSQVTVETSNFSAMIFSLAIALIVTSILTGYKQPKVLGIIYIILSVIYGYVNVPFVFNSPIFQILGIIALPFTFLYLGFFLKHQQVRGN